jgi:hypothetical protein
LQTTSTAALLAASVARNQWQSPREHRASRRGNVPGCNGLFGGEGPEVGDRRKATAVATRQRAPSGQRREGRHGGDTGTATRKGKASKGMAPSGKARCASIWPETRRTPWLAARRNRLARHIAEETVGVGRNDKGGTRVGYGNQTPKVRLRSNREWTRSAQTAEGRSLMKLKRGARFETDPRGKVEKRAARTSCSLRERCSQCQAPTA